MGEGGGAVFASYALLPPSDAFSFLVDGVFFFFFCQSRVKLSMSSCESLCLSVHRFALLSLAGLVCIGESPDGVVHCIGVQIFIAYIPFIMLLIPRARTRKSRHSSCLVSLYLC